MTDWPKLRDRGKRYPEAYELLEELRAWFANEVEAGDEELSLWLAKIDVVLTVKEGA